MIPPKQYRFGNKLQVISLMVFIYLLIYFYNFVYIIKLRNDKRGAKNIKFNMSKGIKFTKNMEQKLIQNYVVL